MGHVVVDSPVPLRTDETGTVRVAGSRIPLDTVVIAFQQGATPEEIVASFPTLRLSDVYAIIGYYLRFRDEVDAYLAEREQTAQQLRAQIESYSSQQGLREKLLARRAAMRS